MPNQQNFRNHGDHIDSTNVTLSFPFELIAHTVGYLGDDFEALSTCSLMCRQWHHAAGPLIFERVLIYDATRAQELCDMIEVTPVISRWIKVLSFDLYGHEIRKEAKVSTFDWLGADVLKGIEFPRLQSIHFSSIRIHDTHIIPLLDSLTKFQTVRRISLRHCHYLDSLLDFVSRFPLLDTLTIKECGRYSTDIGATKSPKLTHLSKLSIMNCSWKQGPLLAWFASAAIAEHLRSITIDLLYESHIQETNRLLEVAGPRLQFLRIRFPSWSKINEGGPGVRVIRGISCSRTATREVVMKGVDLRHNTGLRNLRLHTPASPELLLLIDQLNPSELRTISIVLSLSTLGEIRIEDYEAFDRRLAMSDFNHLEKVSIEYSLIERASHSIDEVEHKMHRAFPSASARGILQVERLTFS